MLKKKTKQNNPESLCSTSGCREGSEESPTARNNEQKANVKRTLINQYIHFSKPFPCQHLQYPDRARSGSHRERLGKEQLSWGVQARAPIQPSTAVQRFRQTDRRLFPLEAKHFVSLNPLSPSVFPFYLPRTSVVSLLVLWAHHHKPQGKAAHPKNPSPSPRPRPLSLPAPSPSSDCARTFCTCS